MLPLGEAFAALYDRAGYWYSLDYKRPVVPPLAPTDAEWAQQILNPLSIAHGAEADAG